MAQIIEEQVVITISTLVRDEDADKITTKVINEQMIKNIEHSLQGLVSDVYLVEATEG
jgi:uncharacterized protein YrrD